MIIYLLATLIMGIASGLFFFYFFFKGQFDDVEEAKYEMFRRDKDA